jgi:dihydrofolate reductase
MAKLIYSMLMSLDGYVEDEHGGFDWAAPDEEVHFYINELESSVGTYLYGRRMYETIVCPVVVGGGKRFFPVGVRLDLELVEERRFRAGVVVLRYSIRG